MPFAFTPSWRILLTSLLLLFISHFYASQTPLPIPCHMSFIFVNFKLHYINYQFISGADESMSRLLFLYNSTLKLLNDLFHWGNTGTKAWTIRKNEEIYYTNFFYIFFCSIRVRFVIKLTKGAFFSGESESKFVISDLHMDSSLPRKRKLKLVFSI